MYQVDIVPTVSLLLGMPIPFSNLGMVIPELFLLHMEEGQEDDSKQSLPSSKMDFEGRVTVEFLKALRINSDQISSYLETYIEYSDDFPQNDYQSLKNDLHRARQLHGEISSGSENSQRELSNVATAYIKYMKAVKAMCQSVWAKFENRPILEGLALLLVSVCVALASLSNLRKAAFVLTRAARFGLAAGSLLALTAQLAWLPRQELSPSSLLSLALSLSFYSLLMISFSLLWYMRHDLVNKAHVVFFQSSYGNLVYGLPFSHALATAIAALYSLSLLSNSFILYEADMVNFLLQTMVVGFALERLKGEHSSAKETGEGKSSRRALPSIWIILQVVALMTCIRVTGAFHACRDLQVGCEPSSLVLPLTAVLELPVAKLRFLCSCLCVTGVPVSLAALLRHNKHYECLSKWLLAAFTYLLPVASVCACGFWALLALPQSTLDSLPPWQYTFLPRAAYSICGTVIVLAVVSPFRSPVQSLSREEATSSPVEVDDGRSPTANTAQFRKRVSTSSSFSEDHCTGPSTSYVPSMVSGRETVAVLPLVILLGSLWVPLAMLLNDGAALASSFLAVQVALSLSLFRSLQGLPACRVSA